MALLRSAQVSVNAQKYGWLRIYPMGKLRGISKRGSLEASGGRQTAKWRAAAGLSSTR